MSKKLLIPLSLALVLTLLVGGVAWAQGAGPKVDKAVQAAKVTGAVGAARLPAGFGDWATFDAVAGALKLTPAQLFEQLHNKKTLKEIAASLGFENQFYFSRVFKNSSVKSSRSRQLRADYAPLLAGRSHGRKMSGFDGWLARNGITQLIRLPPCQCHQLKAQMACSEQFGRHRKSLAPVAFSLLSRDFQLNRPWLSLVTGNFPLRAPGPAMGNGKSDAFSTRFSFLGEGGLTISPHR